MTGDPNTPAVPVSNDLSNAWAPQASSLGVWDIFDALGQDFVSAPEVQWIGRNADALMRIGFGAVDVFAGAAMTLGSGGLGIAPGVGLMVVGADQIATGAYDIGTGTRGPSVIEFGGYAAALSLGADEGVAQTVGTLTPAALSLIFTLGGSMLEGAGRSEATAAAKAVGAAERAAAAEEAEMIQGMQADVDAALQRAGPDPFAGAAGESPPSGLAASTPRLTGVPEFDQLAEGTDAFRRFAARAERAGFEVGPTTFADDTIAAFDILPDGTRVFQYDAAEFRMVNLLHENRHLGQIARAEGMGIDVFGPNAMGRRAIRNLLETEAYGMDLWLAERYGFSADFVARTQTLLRNYTGILYRLGDSPEFANFARDLIGYDLAPYIPRRGASPWIQ